jgi:ribosomal protein S18 acetylase RimI-like enzyme
VKERGGTQLKIGTLGENDAAHRLLDGAGYRPVRHYFRMTIELDECPAEPVWPDGITCETFDIAYALAFHQAIAEAFEEEWNFRPMPFEEWKRHRLGAPDFDPTLWFVARDDTEIAGVIRCEPQRWGGGWVGMLGVRRPWRRRGVGLALLQRAFCEFYDRGERRVGLGVDAQNATGATRLYERVGMRVRAEDIIFEKAMA